MKKILLAALLASTTAHAEWTVDNIDDTSSAAISPKISIGANCNLFNFGFKRKVGSNEVPAFFSVKIDNNPKQFLVGEWVSEGDFAFISTEIIYKRGIIDEMKRGNNITVKSEGAVSVSFSEDLKGFTKSYNKLNCG